MTGSDDTIVAVSSPPGRSARGLIRLTGPKVLCILGRLLQPPDKPVDQLQAWPAPRRLVPCRIQLPTLTSPIGDDVSFATLPTLVVMFYAPRSYTGQDLAEIQCPGNPALLARLIRRTVELGARLAEPGEFTFRAFLVGKLDLTQAEGVAATIAATNDGQLQAAALLRQGQLGHLASQWVKALADLLALVEAGIDFVDQEDVVPISPSQLDKKLARLIAQLDDLIKHSRSWAAVEAMPRVVLVGPPSTGKSTLFNALLGRHRAVISPLAGTTRDVLMEPLTIGSSAGQPTQIMLVDMAGLDTPQSKLDRQAQGAAKQIIAQADLILLIDDCSTTDWLVPTDTSPSGVDKTPTIRVRTKADQVYPSDEQTPPTHLLYDIAVSVYTGLGLDQLRLAIAQHAGNQTPSVTGQMLVLQPRHEAALGEAYCHLCQAQDLIAPQRRQRALDHVELVACAMRNALDELASLGGQMTADDVIGRVFATFCVGK